MTQASSGLEADRVGGLVQPATGDGHRPVAAAVVEQPRVAVVVRLAVVGERVAVGAGQLGQQVVERRGVPQLVLGERAHRHVLLEERRDAGPLGVAEADDELVVGHGQEQLDRGRGRGGAATRHRGARLGLGLAGLRARRRELVAHDVAAGLLERAVERWLEQVRVGQVDDVGAAHDPQPDALLAAPEQLPGVVGGQGGVGRHDAAAVAHRVAVLLLAEDLPRLERSGVGRPRPLMPRAARPGSCRGPRPLGASEPPELEPGLGTSGRGW